MGDLNIEMAAKPVPRQTIRTLAAEIRQRWPGLEVKVESVTANTDRKIGRLRWQGTEGDSADRARPESPRSDGRRLYVRYAAPGPQQRRDVPADRGGSEVDRQPDDW